MQFKHPEILYFLLLLIIPVLVHLFQLRKFKKEYFTNVQILKKLSIQTRKSSKIKKWLLLATRLLLFTMLILAFAQPFFIAKDNQNANNELFIILDNSFSMQAKGQNGPLLKRAIEDLLLNVPQNKSFSLLTCSDNFFETDIKSVQNDLQNLKYSPNEFQIDRIITQINTKTANKKDILIITDGVGMKQQQRQNINKNSNINFVIPKSEQNNNVSIDSVYISQTLENFYEISVRLTSTGNTVKPIMIALYNQKKLEAKTIMTIDSKSKIQKFTISKMDFQGYVKIEDNSLLYDNTYFFSISEPKKTNVISIGATNESVFLRKIYTKGTFNYNNFEVKSLDYNILDNQDAIILNEVADLPQALQITLKNFVNQGGNLIFIPSADQNNQVMNLFLKNFGNYQFEKRSDVLKQITKIVFDHPLYEGVFEKKVTNFQYPNTKTCFSTTSNASKILEFEDQSAFLSVLKNNISNVYIFSAALNSTNSNFQNSPLIVPTFLQMAKNNHKNAVSSLIIGKKNIAVIDVSLDADEILEIRNLEEKFVPLQQILNQKIKLSLSDLPTSSGNFGVYNKAKNIGSLSFNYNRVEGNFESFNPNLLADYKIVNDIQTYFENLQFNRTDNQIWKLFLFLTLLFLVFEILIQKFVK